MQNLLARLGRLETAIITKPPGAVRRFVVQGPHGMSTDEAASFLQGQGHDLGNTGLNIIRVVVAAEDGRPIDLPLADLTPEQPR
ncbi:hypothetical protein SAMN05216360_12912 [Methylobacterium phyllostachyos]|uniref:Uncharacterized protein n=1 Tax=Methylobacterium phyllostachyos TaxID=582672 RepID=A0A1H0KU08_9HYPH|nr:hypothetical protein [Methylobacterium phyllostachyos]SDO59335.1 hypothetical protein SAMN05216360_12912 [Methylobacterium phyllostachyos]